ncbi:MAG TPA: hypothetical protein VH500_14755 [Nitrososphaeraceae archaeon]|jgi:hypothetical protein
MITRKHVGQSITVVIFTVVIAAIITLSVHTVHAVSVHNSNGQMIQSVGHKAPLKIDESISMECSPRYNIQPPAKFVFTSINSSDK